MQRSLTPLLVRGLLGTALSVAAVAAAATQAVAFEGVVGYEGGRLVLIDAPAIAQCDADRAANRLANTRS